MMTSMKKVVLFFSCMVSVLSLPAAGDEVDLTKNGDFNDGLNHWINHHTADPNMIATHDPAVGNPAGSAYLIRDKTAIASNGHRFTQAAPVTVGNTYQIAGDWKGDLRATPGTEHRNWIEVFVAFSGSPDPATVTNWGPTEYKKRYDDEDGNLVNLLPAQNGVWDWESILDSPDAASTGGQYEATGDYMFIAFNLGGRAGAGEGFVWVDNLKVLSTCRAEMPEDLSDNCVVNIVDFALMAVDWMECNLVPQSACTE